MEFFGLTQYGPQNYIKDMLKDGYQEPMNSSEVEPLMKKVVENSTCPDLQRPDVTIIRLIDCYLGRVNGFAYGSFQRFNKMKRKTIIKAVGPEDIYRLPPTTYNEYGWFMCDPALKGKDWYNTFPVYRYPQPISPNTRVVEIVRRNNKYATLF